MIILKGEFVIDIFKNLLKYKKKNGLFYLKIFNKLIFFYNYYYYYIHFVFVFIFIFKLFNPGKGQ